MSFTITLDGIMYTIAIAAIVLFSVSMFLRFLGVGDD